MSAQTKFLLAVFYVCAFMALFAPMVLAQSSLNSTSATSSSNISSITPVPTGSKNSTTATPTSTTAGSGAGAVRISSSVALFGALVAAVFTI